MLYFSRSSAGHHISNALGHPVRVWSGISLPFGLRDGDVRDSPAPYRRVVGFRFFLSVGDLLVLFSCESKELSIYVVCRFCGPLVRSRAFVRPVCDGNPAEFGVSHVWSTFPAHNDTFLASYLLDEPMRCFRFALFVDVGGHCFLYGRSAKLVGNLLADAHFRVGISHLEYSHSFGPPLPP